jgi:hypothetical protein
MFPEVNNNMEDRQLKQDKVQDPISLKISKIKLKTIKFQDSTKNLILFQ